MKLFESYIKELDYAFHEIDVIFSEAGIDYCIIGGAALGKYGFLRQTEDIDILVSKLDKKKLDNLPIGYIRKITDKLFHLHEPEAKIEVIYSGEIAGNKNGIPYYEPIDISIEDKKTHAQFISLYALVIYKLSAGIYGKRLKDFGDVQELIIRNKLPIDYLDKEREDIKNKYLSIWNLIYEDI